MAHWGPMMSRAVVVAALAACTSSINYAGLQTGPRHATFHESARSTTLPNGLKVAVVPDDRANLVTVLVRYDVGISDDPDGAAGLSHLVEHLLHGQQPGDSGDPALTGNAVTSDDRTYFFATALDGAVDTELEIAAHRFELGCDAFPDDVLARERDVVIEELKQRGLVANPYNRMMSLVWGASHPYAKHLDQFKTASRDTFCKFLAEHYGPGAATLVVSGRVDPGLEQRIIVRFAKLASRPVTTRAPAPAVPTVDENIVIPGLDVDVAVLAMPFESSRAVAAVLTQAGFSVRGEDRGQLLVVAVPAEPDRLHETADRLRRHFAEFHVEDIDEPRRDARNSLVAALDDQLGVATTIADQLARGERPNRYRDLEQLDALSADEINRAIRPARIVLVRGDGSKRDAATSLGNVVHHLDVHRAADAPVLLPTQHAPTPVADYTLSNGMRVLLSPDLSAASVDARLVIATDNLTPAWRADARQVPHFLQPPMPTTTADQDTAAWYARFGAPMQVSIRPEATSFTVHGSALFADWDVWSLANHVVAGEISVNASFMHKNGIPRDDRIELPKPTASEVALERLDEMMPRLTEIDTRDRLNAFRDQTYGPRVATLIVSGKFDETAMRREIEALYGGWRGGALPTPGTYRAQPHAPATVAIADDKAQQVEIAIGFASTGNYTDRERVAREVLSTILADRVRVLREGLGVSYGANALVVRTAVLCVGAVDLAFATEAGKALADELARLRTGDIDPSELARARSHVIARKLAQPAGASLRAAMLEAAVRAKQPLDQNARDLELVRSLDLTSIKALAMRDLQPGRMIAVVRGPKLRAEAVLAALGLANVERM